MFIFFKTILHTVPFDEDGGDVGVVSYCEGGYDGADDQYGEVKVVTIHTLPRWEHPGPLLFQSICEHSPIWPGNCNRKDTDDGDDHDDGGGDDYHYDQDSDGERESGMDDADRDVPKNGQRGMDIGCC